METVEEWLCHQQQLRILRRDWPRYRVEVLRVLAKYPTAGTGAMIQIALDKHDERYSATTDAENDQILAPPVGFGLIGQTRHHICIDLTAHPEERGL